MKLLITLSNGTIADPLRRTFSHNTCATDRQTDRQTTDDNTS